MNPVDQAIADDIQIRIYDRFVRVDFKDERVGMFTFMKRWNREAFYRLLEEDAVHCEKNPVPPYGGTKD